MLTFSNFTLPLLTSDIIKYKPIGFFFRQYTSMFVKADKSNVNTWYHNYVQEYNLKYTWKYLGNAEESFFL